MVVAVSHICLSSQSMNVDKLAIRQWTNTKNWDIPAVVL